MDNTTKKTIKLKTAAKINLALDILRRLDNGYHEVRMIMQSLDLGDEIEIALSDAPGISLSCPGTDLATDERNLAFRAARILLEEFAPEAGLKIRIDKKIPMAAGLAGGSGDAAAVLIAVNSLLACGLSKEELCERGAKIGADVPYCIVQGTVLAEGIGEKMSALPQLAGIGVLLFKAPLDVSTGWAYESWDVLEKPDHPNVDGLAEIIRRMDSEATDKRIKTMAGLFGNSFEEIVFSRNPSLKDIKAEMIEKGALGALMSGSGPTIFAVFADERLMQEAAGSMRENYPDAFVCVAHMIKSSYEN